MVRSTLPDARSLQKCSPQANEYASSSPKDGPVASWRPNSDAPASVAQSAPRSHSWSGWDGGPLHSGGPAIQLIPPPHTALPTGSRSCERCHRSDTTPPSRNFRCHTPEQTASSRPPHPSLSRACSLLPALRCERKVLPTCPVPSVTYLPGPYRPLRPD